MNAVSTDGAWSIHESAFVDNGVGVGAGPTGSTGEATRNWWGACDGPSGDFSGNGDGAAGNLVVTPYYTDSAQTTLSNETASPCASPFDFGVELQQSATVSQGNDVPVAVYPYNNVEQAVNGTTVELLVDTNNDGQFTDSEVVASQQADFGPGEYRTLNLTYTDVQLSTGQYAYMGRITKNGQTSQSFTNGTLTVQAGNDSSNSPLSGISGQFDDNYDGDIDISELGSAAVAFSQGDLTIAELGAIASAFAT